MKGDCDIDIAVRLTIAQDEMRGISPRSCIAHLVDKVPRTIAIKYADISITSVEIADVKLAVEVQIPRGISKHLSLNRTHIYGLESAVSIAIVDDNLTVFTAD